jgi:predicted ATP-dependent serine protease
VLIQILDWIIKKILAIRYTEAARDTITTGWDVIDDLMDGGLAKGELGVVMAPAGIGKSWLLIQYWSQCN